MIQFTVNKLHCAVNLYFFAGLKFCHLEWVGALPELNATFRCFGSYFSLLIAIALRIISSSLG